MAPIRRRVAQEVGKWLRDAYIERARKVLVIKGEYGTGKSFLLRKIVSDVNRWSTGRGENRPKVIYVYRPSVEAHALNRAILEEIGIDDVRKMVWNVIRHELIQDVNAPVRPDRLIGLIENLLLPVRASKPQSQSTLFTSTIATDIPEPLSALFDPSQNTDHRTFLEEVDKLRINRKQFHDYFRYLLVRGLSSLTDPVNAAFIDLLLAYDEIDAWQSLVNTRAPTRDRADFVRQFLQNLIRLLESDGYTYLFVAIDEFEQITEPSLMSPKDRADYSYTMMEIINRIDHGLGLIISITAAGFDKLEKINLALSDRLNVIQLDPLRIDDVEQLVKFYLNNDQARVDGKNPDRTGLFPFSREVLEAAQPILQDTRFGSTPRTILKYFRRLLEFCADQEIDTIDSNVARKFGIHFREGTGY